MVKKYCIIMVLISLVAGSGYGLGATADLTLQGEVTDSYINYLQTQEVTWKDQVNIGGDTPETMKAHMGLALLSLAYTHVDGDTTFRKVDSLLTTMSSSFDSMSFEMITQVIDPALDFFDDPHATVNYFTDFFNSGEYVTFRDSMDKWITDLNEAGDEAGWLMGSFMDSTAGHLSDEQVGSHITAIQRGTADFEFTLTFADGEFADSLFIFSRDLFNRIDMLDSLSQEMLDHFEAGFTHMDSVIDITGADMTPAITSWQLGAGSMNTLIDSVKMTVQLQPFTPLEIDPADFNKLQSNVAEIDSMLGGETYQFGPSDEGKTISPVTILEYLPGNSLEQIYKGFYRTTTPESYTFDGIFPSGLDSLTLEMLSPDLVMNSMAVREDIRTHFDGMRTAWMDELTLNPDDPDAHMGLAYVDMYALMQDYPETLFEIFRYLDMGRLDSLATEYHWNDLDFSEELTGISNHMDYYVFPEEPTHFIVLMKNSIDTYPQFEIGPNSEFEIVHLPFPAMAGMATGLDLMAESTTMIANGLEHIYHNLDRMFIVDLDPNYLDFSDIESDTMLVLRLEQANPDFMTITQYGISEFHKAGENLRDAFEEMGIFFDEMADLAEAMAPYQDDFGMDAMSMMYDMEDAADFHWMMYEDFAHPDTTSNIDGERVNFSAWFYNPPQSFLQMWKDYVFGVDSTLGGLFPDRFVDVKEELPRLPREFTVYPAYPNPFNPETNIRFDIPKSEHVTAVIYNLRGERVVTLVDEVLPAGQKILRWNGAGVSSGMYYVRVNYRGQSDVQKLVLLK